MKRGGGLDRYADRFYACVADAVGRYFQGDQYAEVRPNHTKRTAANAISDETWTNLRKEFEGEAPFTFSEKFGRRMLHFGDAFTLRVKKFDASMRPRNIPTQMVLDFVDQIMAAPHLPGMHGPTNIDLGYQLVGLAEMEPQVYVRCPNGRRYRWLWELDEPSVAAGVGATGTTDPTPILALRFGG
jgi:hypothetical protein